MNDSLKVLMALQEIDGQIILLRSAREKRPQEMEGDRRRLAEKKKVLEGISQEMKRLRMESDRRELDLNQNESEVGKLRTQLNQAKSNQEYQILKEQIARLEEQDGKIEDAVLQALSEVENLGEAKRRADEEVKVSQVEFDQKLEELNEVLQGIEGQLGQLAQRREDACRSIPTDHLQLYERVLSRHKDHALARVEHQVCQGCFMTVTPQTMNLLLQGRELSQCRNCLRILYLD